MGRRARARARAGRAAGGPEAPPEAPIEAYEDAEGNVLELRAALSPASRRRYAEVLEGSPLSQEDAWHAAVQFLFEHLAVRWTIAGAPIERQGELIARLRAASAPERAGVRDALRRHCAEHFPEVQAP